MLITSLVRKTSEAKSERPASPETIPGVKAILALVLVAFFLFPIGHGCSISHKHGDEDDDEEPFRMVAPDPKDQFGLVNRGSKK